MGPLDLSLREAAAGDLLPLAAALEASRRFGLSLREVEGRALDLGLLPARYGRNRRMLSLPEQRRLFGAAAAVVGLGGLGGYLVEELARLGVGRLALVDPDCFVEHNLNRQILSSPALLGRLKVESAAARVREINPAVEVTAAAEALGWENGRRLLAGAQVVLDALDSLDARQTLASLCRDLGLPLVHGAIAGWYGKVAVQMPGDNIDSLLGPLAGGARGVETELGNPSFTPAVVASLEAAEACKILIGRGELLRGRMLFLDLLSMNFETIHLQAE